MEARFGSLLLRTSISLSFTFCFILTSSSQIPIGIHPLDEKYFAQDVINCRDGSSSFTRDRINDDFCDCADGTDEPGTSACPTGKFYCRNAGSTPRFLFSSRVNDQVCDCCDGSDEYDGSVACPNTCVMGGNAEYNTINYGSRIKNLGSRGKKRGKSKPGGEDSALKLQGLKIVIVVQVVVISALAFWLFRRRVKSRRRNPRS